MKKKSQLKFAREINESRSKLYIMSIILCLESVSATLNWGINIIIWQLSRFNRVLLRGAFRQHFRGRGESGMGENRSYSCQLVLLFTHYPLFLPMPPCLHSFSIRGPKNQGGGIGRATLTLPRPWLVAWIKYAWSMVSLEQGCGSRPQMTGIRQSTNKNRSGFDSQENLDPDMTVKKILIRIR